MRHKPVGSGSMRDAGSLRIPLPRYDNRSTRAADFGQITICGHAESEAWPLASNDGTIKIWLLERALQATASSASSMARRAELTGLARFRESARLGKGGRVQDFLSR